MLDHVAMANSIFRCLRGNNLYIFPILIDSMSRYISVRTQIISLLIVTGIFLVGDKVFARIIDRAYDFSSMPDAMLYSGRGKADVVILGNSRAYHHFNDKDWSQELGLGVKTYAIEAASMEYNEALLKDYINIYGPPDVVVLELSCLTWDNGQVMNMRSLSLRSEHISKLLKEEYPKAYYIGKVLNLFNYNSTSFLNVLHKIFVTYKQPILSGQVDLGSVDKLISAEPKKYFLNKGHNLESLKNIQKMSQLNGFDLHLIVAPFMKELINSQDGYEDWVKSLKEEYVNDAVILDYGKRIIDNSYFKDLTHLNESGVKELHKLLRDDGYFNSVK